MDFMTGLIGVGVWGVIFLVWYVRTYPERFPRLDLMKRVKSALPSRRRPAKTSASKPFKRRPKKDFKKLVETVEAISSRDRIDTAQAAEMVDAVKALMEIEPASGQIWEAFALDSLETADIKCDSCGIAVHKTVKRTGVKIECRKCKRWLALKNSKVTVINPHAGNLEEWEK